jgi:hypothetical protein
LAAELVQHQVTAIVTTGGSRAETSGDRSPGGYLGGHVGGARGNDTSASYSFSRVFLPIFGSSLTSFLVGHLDNDLGLYRYRYLWSDAVYVGVMAGEVALIRPDAIIRDGLDDYLRVDYGRLGLNAFSFPG